MEVKETKSESLAMSDEVENKSQNAAVTEFENILDDDEQIIKTIRPHKGKVFFSRIMCGILPVLLWVLLIGLSICLGETEMTKSDITICVCSLIGICLLISVLILLFTALYYKHTYYAVTNKRLIIRTGIIGVDFKSLDYRNLGASDVNVSILDKILNKNTGTLRFGNASSPMGTNKMYCFSHIVDPYGLYKEIKQYIAKQQETKA